MIRKKALVRLTALIWRSHVGIAMSSHFRATSLGCSVVVAFNVHAGEVIQQNSERLEAESAVEDGGLQAPVTVLERQLSTTG